MTRTSVIVAMIAATIAAAPTTASPDPVTRTAPYDFGCAVWAPCRVPSEVARMGSIQGSEATVVCFGYSLPPYPSPCATYVATAAGISMDIPAYRSVSISARISSTGSIAATACMTLHSERYGTFPVACTDVNGTETVTVGRIYSKASGGLAPGSWDLYVHPGRGRTALLVQSITYTITT